MLAKRLGRHIRWTFRVALCLQEEIRVLHAGWQSTFEDVQASGLAVIRGALAASAYHSNAPTCRSTQTHSTAFFWHLQEWLRALVAKPSDVTSMTHPATSAALAYLCAPVASLCEIVGGSQPGEVIYDRAWVYPKTYILSPGPSV